MKFIRGDTYTFRVCRKDTSGNIITDIVDEMYFTVKKTYTDKDYKFQKRLTNGDITFNDEDYYYYITINPEDTDNLGFQSYVWDIQIVVGGAKKTTTGTMTLQKEVTTADNEV